MNEFEDRIRSTVIEIPERWMTSSTLPVWSRRCQERMRSDITLSHLPIPQGMIRLAGHTDPIVSYWIEEDPVPMQYSNDFCPVRNTGSDIPSPGNIRPAGSQKTSLPHN